MIRIAFCDDCSYQTRVMWTLLQKYQVNRPGLEIKAHSFSTANEVLAALDAGNCFDLYLLDIIMPELNGIELAQTLRERGIGAPVVFLTASKDYALDAFGVSAVQYLLKPVGADILFPILDKIIAAMKREEENFFLFFMPRRTIKIPFMSIVCVELAGRALRVYHESGNVLDGKTIRSPFQVAVKPLLQDSRFLYTHKSFVLNMSYVEELTKNSFKLKDGVEVLVPRYRFAQAKAAYLAWADFASNVQES